MRLSMRAICEEADWRRPDGQMALCVLTYNLTRALNIIDIKPLMAAIQA